MLRKSCDLLSSFSRYLFLRKTHADSFKFEFSTKTRYSLRFLLRCKIAFF